MKALLMIDIQNDYFPGGRMPLENTRIAAENARSLLEKFRQNLQTIIHIQHTSIRPGAIFLVPGTVGAEIHPLVSPAEGEVVFVKHFPNSFRGTDLLGYLKSKDITDLVVCGMMTHMCVDSTVRAAFDLGFNCTLIEDACTTRALTYGNKTVEAEIVHDVFVSALGPIFSRVMTTQNYLGL